MVITYQCDMRTCHLHLSLTAASDHYSVMLERMLLCAGSLARLLETCLVQTFKKDILTLCFLGGGFLSWFRFRFRVAKRFSGGRFGMYVNYFLLAFQLISSYVFWARYVGFWSRPYPPLSLLFNSH